MKAELQPYSRELFWLAGVLEGEGSFCRGPPSQPGSPILQVAMTDADVMERIGQMFGRAVLRIRPRQAHWHVTYLVRVQGAPAVAWMRLLRPLMGKRRQLQIDRAVESYECRSNRRLDDKAAREALARLGGGESVRSVAEHFGVTIWCIYDLRLGRTHKHLTPAA
jgi:hypothetical protein